MATVITLILSSCGGGIKPADPAITYQPYKAGNMFENEYVNVPVKGMFEIASVAATIVPDDEYPNLYSLIKATINVKTIKTPEADGNSLNGDCTIQLLDKDGAVIAETSWAVSGKSELFNSEAGDVTTISADLGDEWSDSVAKEMLAKIKYIRLAGVGCGYKKANVNNEQESLTTEIVEDDDNGSLNFSSSTDSSEDWNAVLDSYENYVAKYTALYKKAQNGDMDALSEYPALMKQAQNLSEKLTDAKGSMSEEQWARYVKITNKMASEIAQ